MFARVATVLAVLLASSTALAQEPEPAPAKVIPAPAATNVQITADCSLGDHPGVADAEARTAADVVCYEIAKQGATGGKHEVRFGTLGGQTLMTVATYKGEVYDERRTLVAGLGEVPVAAPRLVTALHEGKPLDETRTVDNVLETETRRAKQQNGTMGFDGAIFGTTGAGASSGTSAGLALGLLYRASSLGISMQGRAGGIGSGDHKISLATLDVGARYYLSTSDTSPYVGGGFGLSEFTVRQPQADIDGSGFGAHAVAGVEFLRSHHASFSLGLRADLPFYRLEGASYTQGKLAEYVVPVSFDVGVQFH